MADVWFDAEGNERTDDPPEGFGADDSADDDSAEDGVLSHSEMWSDPSAWDDHEEDDDVDDD